MWTSPVLKLAFLTFLSISLSIQTGVEVSSVDSEYCSQDSDKSDAQCFRCADGKSWVKKCDGFDDCGDWSDEIATLCDNCSEDHLFECKWDGQSYCLDKAKYLCNGRVDCDDGSDELTSVCGECRDPEKDCLDSEKECLNPEKFECKWDGRSVCLSNEDNQCDGEIDCDDASDESHCDFCDHPEILHCKYDGNTVCLNRTIHECNGKGVCDDGSDELTSVCGECRDPEKDCLDSERECLDSDKFGCEWYGQSVCVDKTIHWCDGIADCDDGSDEAQCGACLDSDGEFECKWYGTSVCLRKSKYQCDGRIDDCDDGVDEDPDLCGNCDDPEKFECNVRGQILCLLKAKYQCDGMIDCEDGIDEQPYVCDDNDKDNDHHLYHP